MDPLDEFLVQISTGGAALGVVLVWVLDRLWELFPPLGGAQRRIISLIAPAVVVAVAYTGGGLLGSLTFSQATLKAAVWAVLVAVASNKAWYAGAVAVHPESPPQS